MGAYKTDHVVPLALGGVDDDGGNTVPMHVDCHGIRTFGCRHHREGGDARRIAKTRRLRTHPDQVRSSDGSVYVRDGTERKMR